MKKKKNKEDPLYKFPTKCAVCKECYWIPNGHGGHHDMCMFGGPFKGYAKVVYK